MIQNLPPEIIRILPYKERWFENAPESPTDKAVQEQHDYKVIPESVPVGGRDSYFWGLACSLAKRMSRKKADKEAKKHWAKCEQPLNDVYDWSEVEKKLDRAFESVDDPTNSKNNGGGTTLQQALKKYVFVSDGSTVVDLTAPPIAAALSLADWKNTVNNIKGLSKDWLKHPQRQTVYGQTYYPSDERIISLHGQQYYNEYVPTLLKGMTVPHPEIMQHANLNLFHTHINYIFMQKEKDVEFFLNWLAFTLQQPAKRIPWAPVILSNHQGVGKGFIFKLIQQLVGKRNAYSVGPDEVMKMQFNEWWGAKILWIDELTPKLDFYNTLKFLISETYGCINYKYGRKEHRDIFCNVIATSNHMDALRLEQHDRRFWVIGMTDKPKPAAYYNELFAWLDGPGVQTLYSALLSRDLSGFDHAAQPPMTAAKTKMIDSTLTDIDRLILDAHSAEEDVFKYDLVPYELAKSWVKGKITDGFLDASTKMNITRRLRAIEGGHNLPQASYAISTPAGGKIQVRAALLRNPEKWTTASKYEVVSYLKQIYEEGMR
jgi:hypothetical protein